MVAAGTAGGPAKVVVVPLVAVLLRWGGGASSGVGQGMDVHVLWWWLVLWRVASVVRVWRFRRLELVG